MRWLLLLVVVVVTLWGCGWPTVQSGGFMVRQDWLEEAMADVRPRAAFDLQCPADQISATVVAVGQYEKSYPSQIGFSGCGGRLVYVNLSGNGWVLNSDSRPDQVARKP